MSNITRAVAQRLIVEKTGIERSPAWTTVQRAFLKQFPQCAVCGGRVGLQVHHVFPFHYVVGLDRYDLELDSRNLMTICEQTDTVHHLLLGHLRDWQSYNPAVVAFVKRFAGRTADEVRADESFQKAAVKRPLHLDKMNAKEKSALRTKLRRKYPIDPLVMERARKARGLDLRTRAMVVLSPAEAELLVQRSVPAALWVAPLILTFSPEGEKGKRSQE